MISLKAVPSSAVLRARGALVALLMLPLVASAQPAPTLRASTPEEQRSDVTAFAGLDEHIGERAPDVQSVVVLLRGRVAYQYYRDGQPDALRDTQSVSKSALAALVGAALQQGRIASLEQPVVDLVPEWRQLNTDPRAATITVKHLLSMTAGFAVNDASGTATPLDAPRAWARALRSDPGRDFAYDNSIVNILAAVLEKASGRTVVEYARQALAQPMEMAAPQLRPALYLRTLDMARLGQLFLHDGTWNGTQLMQPGFASAATRPHSRGGPPVQLPYGLAWWTPSANTYFASGYGGQFVWVHPPLELVVAVTSAVSPGSQQRGAALQLIRGPLFEAASKRSAPRGSDSAGPRPSPSR